VQVITEQASSPNSQRQGMKKLLALIGEQAVDVVLIEFPDWLVRFSFGYVEQAFRWKDIRLEVLDPPKQQEPTEEPIQETLTMLTVFAGRRYGHRAKACANAWQQRASECEQEDQQEETERTYGTGQPHHQVAP
jgi:predicted site-specific integrase-resolvase